MLSYEILPLFMQPALNVKNNWWSSSIKQQSQAGCKISFWYIKETVVCFK